jgi:P-type conjugative transfer protein TrbJ
MLHNRLITALCASIALAGLAAPKAAMAQVVYCSNCSTTWTQLADSARQVEMLINQASQLANQIQQYETMVKNTTALPTMTFGNAMNDINRIKSIVNQAQGVAYSASDLDAKFRARYQGAAAYRSLGMDDADYAQKYSQWSSDTSESALTTLKALKSQSDGFSDEDALMQQIQSDASGAEGQLAALGAGNELAVQTVSQIQKLRQLIMTQAALQAQIAQTDQDRRDVAKTQSDAFFYKNPAPSYDGKTY